MSVLEKCSLFEGISEDQLTAILGCLEAQTKTYPKGDFVFRAGTKLTKVGVVLEGNVQLIQEDYWGNRSLLEQIAPGGIFGEAFACTDHAILPLSVIAADDVTILLIDYRRIISVCTSACEFHLRVIKNMVTSMAQKNIVLTRKIEHTSKRTINEKILSYLSGQALRNGSPSFTIPFNRQELADYLAVDRASLSRSLGQMRDEGILRVKGRRFELIEQD